MVGKASNFSQLLDRIKEYRKANAIPIGLGFADEVEREVCLRYSAECSETDPRVPNIHNGRLTIEDVVRGTMAMVAFKMSGSKLVEPEEAERRAKICLKCPYNVDFQRPCGSLCGELKDVVHGIIGSKTTEYDSNLRSCAVCHCYNSSAIWVPLEIQMKGISERQRDQFLFVNEEVETGCWKGAHCEVARTL